MTPTIATDSKQSVKTLSYGDALAHVLLWAKALVLTPLWAIALLPLIGLACRGLGGSATQFGFGLVLVLCVAYFIEDLLKRKIRVDDRYVFFGYRAVPISDIVSVDVMYKKNKFLPGNMLIRCCSGQSLKFSLDGLKDRDLEALVRHLQVRNSNLSTAPALGTLVKCRKVNRKLSLDTPERLEIDYHAHRVFDESIDAFKETAMHWMRLGPLLAFLMCSPIWVMFVSTLFVSLQPYSYAQMQHLNFHDFMFKFIIGLQSLIYDFTSTMSEGAQHVASNPIMACATTGFIAGSLGYLQYSFLRPNLLIADNKGIVLALRLGQMRMMTLPMKRIDWDKISNAVLAKPEGYAGNDTWKIRLRQNDGKKLDVSHIALAPEDRSRLLKRIEKTVPQCQIDAELSQSMLPKSERSYTEIWLQSLSQAPERKTLEPLEPGQILAEEEYEVLKILGVGGQGTAYLCRSLSKDRPETVVLKETILPVFVEAGVRRAALERFEEEARLLKSLDSNCTVNLIDYFIEDHRAYLVLEHIDGSTLRDLILREGPLSFEKAHDVALQMCEILELLHANSIVHRDFTPDNLILNSKGQLKLIDFNVAQQLKEGATGTIVGKHAYLPPEQFRGKATTQSDLYAFGATLFFLLTGTDPEPISQSSPAEANPALSGAFDQIVKRATALQTNKRYEKAEDIERDLLEMNEQDGVILTAAPLKEGVKEHG